MDAAISVARVRASSLDWGFNFQFPLMNGLRAISKTVEEVDWGTMAGEKAEADDKRAAVIPMNFILFRLCLGKGVAVVVWAWPV